MSNQENAVVASKDKIAQFVHDAADMEKREYILRGIAPVLRTKADAIRKEADVEVFRNKNSLRHRNTKLSEVEFALSAARKKLQDAEIYASAESKIQKDRYKKYNGLPEKPQNENQYDAYKEQLGKYDKEPAVPRFEIGLALVYALFALIPVATFAAVAGVIISAIFVATEGSLVQGAMIGGFVGGPIISIIVGMILGRNNLVEDKNRYKKYHEMKKFVEEYEQAYARYRESCEGEKRRQEAEARLADCEKEVKELVGKLEPCRAEIELAKKLISKTESNQADKYKKADWLEKQAKEIITVADAIRERKLKLYSLGIIPPNYRTLDATLMIADIFDNDLADTMREAVLLYDERVFRGEVVRGIDNINRSLDKLNNTMYAVVECLNAINASIERVALEINGVANQIHSMNRDMLDMGDKILDTQNSAARERSAALEEARAMRYATEELNRSQEIMNRYIEDRRNGLI